MGRDREGREIKNGERHRARKGRKIKGGLIVRYELMGHGISGQGSRESGKKMEYRYHVWVQKFFIMGWDRDPKNQSSGD